MYQMILKCEQRKSKCSSDSIDWPYLKQIEVILHPLLTSDSPVGNAFLAQRQMKVFTLGGTMRDHIENQKLEPLFGLFTEEESILYDCCCSFNNLYPDFIE